MKKGVYIIGTSTDIGKTFISGLILKKLREQIFIRIMQQLININGFLLVMLQILIEEIFLLKNLTIQEFYLVDQEP